ncbi:Uncharacterised protein [Serratia fonticola]|nr:Uncharacterised protein [Serratia fonticola]CAI1663779.1 Uncharacterised protein [Serratia fonticola]CAI1700761.1 Uncharacterised protein [Serratia fonticola]
MIDINKVLEEIEKASFFSNIGCLIFKVKLSF